MSSLIGMFCSLLYDNLQTTAFKFQLERKYNSRDVMKALETA